MNLNRLKELLYIFKSRGGDKTYFINSVVGARIFILVFCCSFSPLTGYGQLSSSFFSADSTLNKPRLMAVVAAKSSMYAGSVIALNELWYKDYPRSSFHFFNDNKEWLQMDKFGHAVSAYNIGLYSGNLFRWSGVKQSSAAWYGGMLGFVYLGTIELLDGFSEQWGFSWGDVLANGVGTICYLGQELTWKQQRLKLKFSASPSEYARYRPDVLGKTFSQQLLKDYNAQTYWLSVNVASFCSQSCIFPKWLNVAFGYGGNGMTGGMANPVYVDEAGEQFTFDRYRQYYISLDIDLTRIEMKSRFLKTICHTVGFIKFPLPAIEFNRYGIKGHWIGF